MKKLVLFVWLLVLGAAVVSPAVINFATTGINLQATTVEAATSPSPSPVQTCAKDAQGQCSNLFNAQTCVPVALPILNNGNTCKGGVSNNPAQGGAIVVYLRQVLQLMSSAVGIVILLMLVIAGIQYITSTGNPSLVAAAKKRIINALTALFLFLFMTLILQFIVPGGIL